MRLSQVQGYLVFPNRLTERGGGDIIGVKKERIPDPLFDEISPFGRNDRASQVIDWILSFRTNVRNLSPRGDQRTIRR